MNISALTIACKEALEAGHRISLTFPKGKRRMRGFPRGELLVENPNTGERTYSFDPAKLLMSMHKAGVIVIRLTDRGQP